jgi:type VI secretion system protein ImpH
VWRKYRYPAGFRTGGTDEISRYLLSLAGLGIGTPEIERTVGTRKLLSMLGLVGQRTRTAEGLAGILQHAVPDARITVIEFHPVWVESNHAGSSALGENCVLGRGFYDRANTVRVIIVPQMRESVLALMPGRTAHLEIIALLCFYLGYEANAHLEMHVAPGLMPEPAVSPAQVSLGYTTQLQHACATSITRVHLGIWNGQRARHWPAKAWAAY